MQANRHAGQWSAGLEMCAMNAGRQGGAAVLEEDDEVAISSPDDEDAERPPSKRGRGRPKKGALQQRQRENRSSDLDDEYVPAQRGLKRQVTCHLPVLSVGNAWYSCQSCLAGAENCFPSPFNHNVAFSALRPAI